MRPLKLTLQAFGAYPNKVVIPFEDLGANNLYLIYGVTGSGKTTIFDAICYALFNRASGSYKANSDFRSHFAKEDVETFVEFEFEFNNKKYRIYRAPAYERKKKRGDGYTTASAKIELYLPDLKILANNEAEEEIKKVLGVDVNQFCQIALLAQGEFLKILHSNSAQRGEIFRNIFKTADFFALQKKLDTETKNLKNKLGSLNSSILQYFSQIKSHNERVQEIIDNCLSAKVVNFCDELIEKINEELVESKINLSALEKNNSKNNKKITNLSLQIETILTKEKLLNQFKSVLQEVEICKKDEKAINDEFLTVSKKEDESKKIFSELEKLNEGKLKAQQVLNLNEILNKSNEISKAYNNKYQDLKQKHVSYLIQEKQKLEKLLKDKQEEFIQLEKEYKEKRELYNHQYDNYLSSQAGILASNLKSNTPCPVCGAIEHPSPATLLENVITKDELDKIKKQVEKNQANLTKEANICEKLLQEIQQKQIIIEKNSKKYSIKYETLESKEIIQELDFEDEILKIEELISKNNQEIVKTKTQIDILQADLKGLELANILIDFERLSKEYEKLNKSIEKIKKNYQDFNARLNELYVRKIELEKNLADLKDIDVSRIANIKEELDFLNKKQDEDLKNIHLLNNKIIQNSELVMAIEKQYEEFLAVQKDYNNYVILYECASGTMSGKQKLAFEQYIQGYYLDLVLNYANKRLKVMTNNQFQLIRKKEANALNVKTGLDIEVMDFHTYKTRDTKTLSGGESFKASLSLALGLSDCVSNLSGAINLNSMFIDEGFGSLDSESLSLALDVIMNLSLNNRLVGIISHVEELKNRISNKIISLKSDNGSCVKIEFDN